MVDCVHVGWEARRCQRYDGAPRSADGRACALGWSFGCNGKALTLHRQSVTLRSLAKGVVPLVHFDSEPTLAERECKSSATNAATHHGNRDRIASARRRTGLRTALNEAARPAGFAWLLLWRWTRRRWQPSGCCSLKSTSMLSQLLVGW